MADRFDRAVSSFCAFANARRPAKILIPNWRRLVGNYRINYTVNTRFKIFTHFVSAIALAAAVTAHSETSATVTIRGDEPGAVVSSNLFGAFFEEINYAGEGGLYAEMVRNRSFYRSSRPDFWTLVTQGDANGTMTVD